MSDEERSAARRVGEQLRSELSALLRHLPPESRGGAALSRLIGIDRSTCQRVLQASRISGDAQEVLVRMPGNEGLGLFIDALEQQGLPKARIKEARAAVVAFSQLIDRLGGSQAALAKRIQAVGGERGERLSEEGELAMREQAFDAMRLLTGSQIDVQSNVLILRPLPGDAGRVEVIGARDMVGLEGRAGSPPVSGVYFSRADQSLPEGQPRPVPLEAEDCPEAEEEGSTLLPDFCSHPIPQVVTRHVGDVSLELIEPPGSGAPPIDVATAHRLLPPILHPALQDDHRLQLFYHCVVPTRRVLLHAYLHRSMAAGCLAEAHVHQRSTEVLSGHSEPWYDQLEQRLVIEILGSDLAAAGRGAGARQERFLEHLFGRAGWNPGEFVGYRLAVDWPLWSCRYTMGFEFTA
ncbi:MAG: hypothetical protein R3F33_05950 [Planctomycetota bacterium]